MALVVAGLSRNVIDVVCTPLADEFDAPEVRRFRLPAASPNAICVESRKIANGGSLARPADMDKWAITNTLLLALVGVMLTDSPVTSTSDVLVVVNVSVFAVDLTCATPLVTVLAVGKKIADDADVKKIVPP